MRASPIRFTGWPTKMFLFFFGNNFYKNKETFKIFSPQLLEVYRIILVKTTLESIMFYYTFSVINTMYDPCTGLLYDSTAATWTLKLSPCDFSSDDVLSRLWIVFTNSVSPPHFSKRTLKYLRHNFPWVRLILHQTDNPWPSCSQDLEGY